MYENNAYYSENNNNQNCNGSMDNTVNNYTGNNATNSTAANDTTANNTTANNTTGAYSGAQNMNNDSNYQNYNYSSTYSNAYGDNYYGSSNSNNNKPEKKKSSFAVKALTFAVCGALFGVCAGAGFYGINRLNNYLDGDKEVTIESSVQNIPSQTPAAQLTIPGENTVITTDATEVVEDVMPAMVSIINNYLEKSTFFGKTFTQEAKGSGSGIIIAQDETELLIATNYHVIQDAESIEVTFINGSTAEAKVKGKDSGMDLAVIAIPLDSIDAETKQAITIAKMGDSEALKLGEPVIAIGNALGYGQSVTGGWVSALNREVGMEDGSTGTFIQTDAAINGGNSGGALLNMNGEVIGINSSKISGYGVEGMGYAIPISAAEPIISELMTKETRVKIEDGNIGYMGVSFQAVPSDYVRYYNYPAGVMVMSVEEGSPAEQAGLLTYDIITNFDGEQISDYEELQAALQYYAPGDEAKLIVSRIENGRFVKVELKITLGERPEE